MRSSNRRAGLVAALALAVANALSLAPARADVLWEWSILGVYGDRYSGRFLTDGDALDVVCGPSRSRPCGDLATFTLKDADFDPRYPTVLTPPLAADFQQGLGFVWRPLLPDENGAPPREERARVVDFRDAFGGTAASDEFLLSREFFGPAATRLYREEYVFRTAGPGELLDEGSLVGEWRGRAYRSTSSPDEYFGEIDYGLVTVYPAGFAPIPLPAGAWALWTALAALALLRGAARGRA